MQCIHVPFQIHCWNQVILLVSLCPVITVNTDTHVAFAERRVVNLDKVADVGVNALHVRALENIGPCVDRVLHEVDVYEFPICGFHVPTQDTCINSSVFCVKHVVSTPLLIFIIAHQMIPVCFGYCCCG